MKMKLTEMLIFGLAIFLTAMFTPWWGTPIVIAASLFVFKFPFSNLIALCFFGWATAAAARDTLAEHGPSRVIAKMLNIEFIGFGTESLMSRLIVYMLAGAIGFLFATFTGGLVKAIRKLLPEKLFIEKTLR